MTGDLSQAARSNVWERKELAAFIQKRREIIRAGGSEASDFNARL